MIENLPFVLDSLVLLFLFGTIVFAIRLSVHLRVFEQSRRDIEKLVSDLSWQIEKAEHSIQGLRENARESGRDLQSMINEARALSDEMQVINESGGKLAHRLENLSDKNRSATKAVPEPFALFEQQHEDPVADESKKKESVNQSSSPFFIRDPEFDREEDSSGDDFEENESGDGFQSRAEKELFEALRKGKTEAGGVS